MTAPVSIVIPVHNGRALLEQLLASREQQTIAPLEIIVVDNGSSDGAPECAQRAGARVIAMGRNAGFAAAVNRGIREARGEAVALLNSDVELDRDWLDVLWGEICSAGVDFGTGKILQHGAEGILDGSFDLICRGGCSWRAGAGQPERVLENTLHMIQFCSATAVIYRSVLFDAIGLFDEAFGSYLEDVDFGLRCASAGRKGGYFRRALCRHRGSSTFGRWNPRVVRLIARNQIFLIARHYSWELIRRWWWPILVAHLLWGGLAIRHGCGVAWLCGKTQGVWHFASVRRSMPTPANLASTIAESERQIHEIQSRGGFDVYWRWYFRLAGISK